MSIKTMQSSPSHVGSSCDHKPVSKHLMEEAPFLWKPELQLKKTLSDTRYSDFTGWKEPCWGAVGGAHVMAVRTNLDVNIFIQNTGKSGWEQKHLPSAIYGKSSSKYIFHHICFAVDSFHMFTNKANIQCRFRNIDLRKRIFVGLLRKVKKSFHLVPQRNIFSLKICELIRNNCNTNLRMLERWQTTFHRSSRWPDWPHWDGIRRYSGRSPQPQRNRRLVVGKLIRTLEYRVFCTWTLEGNASKWERE